MGDRSDETYSKTWLFRFGEDSDEWDDWKVQVEANARKKGWWDLMVNERELNRESEEEEDIKLMRKNDEAYLYLTAACKKDAFKYVKCTEGDAYTAWQALMERYKEVEIDDLVNLHKQFGQCIMEDPKSDPKLWFNELEKLRKKIEEAQGGLKLLRKSTV